MVLNKVCHSIQYDYRNGSHADPSEHIVTIILLFWGFQADFNSPKGGLNLPETPQKGFGNAILYAFSSVVQLLIDT